MDKLKRFADPGKTMDKLKPCPFCGGEAEIHRMRVSYKARSPKYEGIALVARCKKCYAYSPHKRGTLIGNFRETEETKAIEAWNRRASDG